MFLTSRTFEHHDFLGTWPKTLFAANSGLYHKHHTSLTSFDCWMISVSAIICAAQIQLAQVEADLPSWKPKKMARSEVFAKAENWAGWHFVWLPSLAKPAPFGSLSWRARCPPKQLFWLAILGADHLSWHAGSLIWSQMKTSTFTVLNDLIVLKLEDLESL